MSTKRDVVIVGSGPAGIFAALEFAKADAALSVLILEKGKDLYERRCPVVEGRGTCFSCALCDLVSGWGGAGAFSDGKLTLSPQVGGRLPEFLGWRGAEELIRYVEEQFLLLGAPARVYGEGPEVQRLVEKARAAGLTLTPIRLRHLGTEHCKELLHHLRCLLQDKVELRTRTEAKSIRVRDGRVWGVETSDGEFIEADYLIVAPGREGADWLLQEASRLGLSARCNPVDIGVRVEVPNEVLSEFTDVLYESKLEYRSPRTGDRVRTFCMCPSGEVTAESTGGPDPVITVNGHSFTFRRSENTNFALLVSVNFENPFHHPIAYGKHLARLANDMGRGVIVQRLGDLLRGRCSAPSDIEGRSPKPTLKIATPGDLGIIIPYRFLRDIIEMLERMELISPGVSSPDTLLYGVEVKFYSARLDLSPSFETGIRNLFAVGDGAGVSRGLVQAAASGIVAAREILRRRGKGDALLSS